MDDQGNQTFTQEDINQNKTIAALAYLIFFLPMLAAKDSAFAKFHGNQGLWLFLGYVAVNIVGSILPYGLWFIVTIADLVLLVFGIIAVINTLNGKAQTLPFVGHINLINK